MARPPRGVFVLGRGEGEAGRDDAATGRFGRYLARDGSAGAPVGVDLERPHAAVVVGKRGTGKSYTLGVLAEAAARADGIAPVVLDPMGVFGGLAASEGSRPAGESVPAVVHDAPTVPAAAVSPPSWPALLGLDATGAVGALVWQAAAAASTLDGMCEHVDAAEVTGETRRSARNHLRHAASWGVFAPDGLDADGLTAGRVDVVDLSGMAAPAANAVAHAVVDGLYRRRVAEIGGDGQGRLPWVLVDEAHVFFDGIAASGLRRILTRGRAPGVSLVVATQRPSALPAVAVSQADLLVAHRLSSRADLAALSAARPTYLGGPLGERLPENPGEALVVDDTTETVQTVRVRERATPHRGDAPRASERAAGRHTG